MKVFRDRSCAIKYNLGHLSYLTRYQYLLIGRCEMIDILQTIYLSYHRLRSNVDELVKSRIHQVVGVKFYVLG